MSNSNPRENVRDENAPITDNERESVKQFCEIFNYDFREEYEVGVMALYHCSFGFFRAKGFEQTIADRLAVYCSETLSKDSDLIW